MNKLNKLYKAMLEALGCVIKEDYSIFMSRAGQEVAVKVDEKQTYLPVNEALDEVSYDRAFFHPACESIASKETEMDKVLRKLISSSLYFNFRPIADVLFKVAGSKSSKTLPPKMLEELAPLKNINKKIIAEVVDIVKRISMTMEAESLDTRIVSLTLKRGGKTENDEHIFYRCTPQFPFYKELKRLVNQNSRLKATPEETIVFGDNRYTYQAACCVCVIFELAIPSVKDPSRLENVSINQTAARMTAMLRTFGLIADEINTLIGKFRKEFDEIGVYGINLDWIETLDELPEIAQLVPSLEYNNYNTKPEKEELDASITLDPFNIARERDSLIEPTVVVQQQSTVGGIKAPKTLPGETYIGMKAHNNGVSEFRFRNGNEIRIVCLGEDGRQLSEKFVGCRGTVVGGRPAPTGWEDDGEYEVLRNGVRVPILSRGGYDRYRDERRYDDRYYDRRDYYERDFRDERDRDRYRDERDHRGGRPRTGWGVDSPSEERGVGSSYFDYNSNF